MTKSIFAMSMSLAATAACLLAATAAAHHSNSMYDLEAVESFSGVVTRYEWASPHVYVYVETLSEEGTGEVWEIEAGPPALMTLDAGEHFEWAAAAAIHGFTLWTDFFHVFSKTRASPRTRVYVHATNWSAGLEIMKVIVGQYSKIPGIMEAKICGPGSRRVDTIVAYLTDGPSRDALVKVLASTAATRSNLFEDTLPPLVKREAKGIGSSDEPPEVEIRAGHTRHSFGSFYAALIWVALKATPQIGTPNADGRHMLDNLLHSLRLLRVDPPIPRASRMRRCSSNGTERRLPVTEGFGRRFDFPRSRVAEAAELR